MFHPRKSIAGITHPEEKEKQKRKYTESLATSPTNGASLQIGFFQIADADKWKEMEHSSPRPFSEYEWLHEDLLFEWPKRDANRWVILDRVR